MQQTEPKESQPIHILLIGIDSLRLDIIKNNFPEFHDMVYSEGHFISDCYTHSGPTQMAHPSVICGGLPLDGRGYGDGVLYNKETLAEFYKNRGYKTLGVVTNPWLGSSFGYDRGFTSWKELYDINTIWADRLILIKDAFKLNKIKQAIKECYKRIDAIDDAIKKQGNQSIKKLSSNIYSMVAVQKLVKSHRTQLVENESEYVLKAIKETGEIENLWDNGKIKELYCNSIIKFMCIPYFPKKIRRIIRDNFFFRYASANEVIDQYTEFRKSTNAKDSTFSWIFLFDPHERIWFEFCKSKNILNIIKYMWNVVFKKLMLYTGNENYIYKKSVRRLINTLHTFINKYEKISKNTFVLQYVDHGASIKKEEGNMVCSFFKDYINVPLFTNRRLKEIMGCVNGMLGLSDINEIVKSIHNAHNKPKKSYGKNVIILENTGRGICDPNAKGVNIGYVSRSKIKSFYFKNIYENLEEHNDVPLFIRQRLKEIKENFGTENL